MAVYTEESIVSLTPLEFTRLRPGVYAGDTTYSTQLLIEIVSNAIDEYRSGHGDVITVTIDKNVISCQDHGQGFIPNSFRDDGKTILEAAFSVLNTSGKYSEDGVYEGTSLGSFGIGSKICNFLSHWAKVETARDGIAETVYFKEGVFEKREVKEVHPLVSGTTVTWEPSEEFFTNVSVDMNVIEPLFKTLASLCPGLTIELIDRNRKVNKKFYSENGLDDLVDEATGTNENIKNRFRVNYQSGKSKIDLVMTYTSNYSSTIVPYVNSGLTEAGPHIVQMKSLFTREFNKFIKEKKWIKDKEENLSGEDIQEGMYLIFNITAPNVAYNAQVKTTVTKIDVKQLLQGVADKLQEWFQSNEKEIKLIVTKAVNAKKAREAAKKAREAARSEAVPQKRKTLNLPTKLVDANSKRRLECELFIAEGDSAANGLIKARSAETQGIFPIRGKMINLYKNSPEKVFANVEVNNLKKALGLEFDPRTGHLIYDISKLRYGKIFTACDADADGQAIKNLILTCIWSLCPELILNGHVWVTVPPLYRITKGKDTYIYLRDDAALEEYKATHPGEKYVISRNKGLGEQNPEELEPCILNPETRNAAQIIVPDRKAADELFEVLMGTIVAPRRAWLLEHSEEASDNLW